jgi:hypothetical protein
VADKKTTTATNNTANRRVAAEMPADKLTAQPGSLYARAVLNPSNGYFSLVINSSNPNPVAVRVMDISGRVIATHQKIASSGILRLGQDWSAGNYFAEVVQNEQKKVVKLVKTN